MLQFAPSIRGAGLRPFEGLGPLELEQISGRPVSLATHVRYRVRRPDAGATVGA